MYYSHNEYQYLTYLTISSPKRLNEWIRCPKVIKTKHDFERTTPMSEIISLFSVFIYATLINNNTLASLSSRFRSDCGDRKCDGEKYLAMDIRNRELSYDTTLFQYHHPLRMLCWTFFRTHLFDLGSVISLREMKLMGYLGFSLQPMVKRSRDWCSFRCH